MEIIGDKTRIEKLSDKAYNFNFEKYFSEGWNIFRKAPGQLILYTLIFIGISLGLGLIPIIGAIGSIIISPALSAGYYVGIRKLDVTNQLEIGDFFKSFDFLLQLFLMTLIAGLLTFVGMVFLILPGIWLIVALSFSAQLIVFANLEFWDSIKNSAKIITKNWFPFFAMLIVLGLMNIIGFLFLGLGVFITIPLTFAVLYSSYKDIIGFDDEKHDVIDHLVEDIIT